MVTTSPMWDEFCEKVHAVQKHFGTFPVQVVLIVGQEFKIWSVVEILFIPYIVIVGMTVAHIYSVVSKLTIHYPIDTQCSQLQVVCFHLILVLRLVCSWTNTGDKDASCVTCAPDLCYQQIVPLIESDRIHL